MSYWGTFQIQAIALLMQQGHEEGQTSLEKQWIHFLQEERTLSHLGRGAFKYSATLVVGRT